MLRITNTPRITSHARAYAARCPGTIMMPDAQRYDQFCGSVGFRSNSRSAMVTGAIVNSPGRDEILNAGGIILQTEPFQLSVKRRTPDLQAARNFRHLPPIMADRETDRFAFDFFKRTHVAVCIDQLQVRCGCS